MGYTKTVITLIKGVPQAYLNYQRKSTVGRAILSILLDLTGGVCALANSVLIAWNLSDWGIITGNVPKVALSLITMFFALFFVFQHYVLYPQREDWDVDAHKSLYRPLGLDDDGPLLHAADQMSGP
jgi:cystinosin